MSTPTDITSDARNQIFKVLNIGLVYNIKWLYDILCKIFFVPKASLGKGKNPSCGDRALSTH